MPCSTSVPYYHSKVLSAWRRSVQSTLRIFFLIYKSVGHWHTAKHTYIGFVCWPFQQSCFLALHTSFLSRRRETSCHCRIPTQVFLRRSEVARVAHSETSDPLTLTRHFAPRDWIFSLHRSLSNPRDGLRVGKKSR